MGAIAEFVIDLFARTIGLCYSIVPNYFAALILFTLLTKILLLPLSIMVQKNSIKSVQMQPELNRLKASCFGNKDLISEGQVRIFKAYHYHPSADLVPLLAQLAILMGVAKAVGRATPLTQIPTVDGGATLLVPLFAALSAFYMCFEQNRCNVLQSEQSRFNQYGTLIFSVALSLYLGLFVAIGVGFYWIWSNLFSVVQLWFLNWIINPKKYIDYEALEQSREELRASQQYLGSKKDRRKKNPYSKREKADYKRFMNTPGKKLVFYSEKNGFYKYYRNIIEEILARTNIVVHYITSDPLDEVFSLESEQFRPYYISDYRMIILMMKLDCEIMVMTTPDLGNYQLKRSYVNKDIEYIYVPHDVNSANLTFHKDALDHFDTILSSGRLLSEEIREREALCSLPQKKIIKWGSSVIDNMIRSVAEMTKEPEGKAADGVTDHADGRSVASKTVLIAPSWQKDNILDLCIEPLLDQLKDKGYHLIVRPHPQYVRHFENKLDALAAKYEGSGIEFQKDFSSNKTVYTADLLITDWSSIAFEYAFSTCRPVLFIDTPMKVMNEDYQELKTVPIDIELRSVIGRSLAPEKIPEEAAELVHMLLYDAQFSAEEIAKLRDQYIYRVGESGRIGAAYIIRQLLERQEQADQAPAADTDAEEKEVRRPVFTPGRIVTLEILAMVFTICLYAPFEMVLLNRSEFWFKLSLFWWMPVLFGAGTFIVFALIGHFLKGRVKFFYGVLFFAATLCFYIQGNFLNLRLGLLNGAQHDWSEYRGVMYRDFVVWGVIIVAVLVLAALFKEKIGKVFGFLSFLLIGVQAVSLVSLLIPVFEENDVGAHVSDVQTDAHLYEVGADGNLLVFVVDMFDDDYFRAIRDNEEAVLDSYDGFTWFDNFTGGYSTTEVSLDLLLTGHMSYNEKPREAWRADVWQNRLWLDEVRDAGYDVSFYTPNTVSVPDRMKDIAGNYQEMDLYIKNNFSFFKHLYRLAACKYFPNILKPVIWMDGTEFDGLGEYYNPDNSLFREGLEYNDGLTLVSGKKEFKFIHINGAHYPYNINADGSSAPGGSDAYAAATGTLTIIANYLEEMKANGTYDSSSIVITADHGYYWDGVLSNPVCLIKPAGAHGPVAVNHAPACHRNLFPTLVRLAGSDNGAAYGTDIFDLAEDADVDRYFYQYYLLEGNVDGNYRMIEFHIPPASSDVENFTLTDVEITYHGEKIPHAQYCASCQGAGEWLDDQEKPRYVHECAPDNPSASEVKHLENF